MTGAAKAVAGVMAVTVVCVACERGGPATIERLKVAVAAYGQGKAEPTDREIDALFAQVDAEIAALRAEAAAKPAGNAAERMQALQRERLAAWQSYMDAKVERLRGAAEDTVRGVGKQIGQGLEEAGRRIQESMEKE